MLEIISVKMSDRNFLLPKVFSVSLFSKNKAQNNSLEDLLDISAM